MSKPLIRVTTLEAFRRYLANSEYDRYEITEQSVIDSVTGVFEGNTYTRVGTAFHSVIEDCGESRNAEVVEGGFKFDIDGNDVCLSVAQVQTALDYRNEHPYAYHEIRKYKDYGRAIVTGGKGA